jgi:hypothetical protein
MNECVIPEANADMGYSGFSVLPEENEIAHFKTSERYGDPIFVQDRRFVRQVPMVQILIHSDHKA